MKHKPNVTKTETNRKSVFSFG